jgi:hypothetical protein
VTVRSLNARLARLEDQIIEPQGPVVYRVCFHDGTPVWPRSDEESAVVLDAGAEVVYRIASWEESEWQQHT